MTELTVPLHPRPRLVRERWIDLNGPWGFAYDDDDVGLDQRWQDDPQRFGRTITVPFPPESTASGIGDTGFHPVVWYRRTFAASAGGRALDPAFRRHRLPCPGLGQRRSGGHA